MLRQSGREKSNKYRIPEVRLELSVRDNLLTVGGQGLYIMSIVNADMTTLKEVVDLAILLFPQEDYDELFDVYNKSLTRDNEFVFLYEEDGIFVGYLHLSIRNDYVNGTDFSPVMFMEAIYVLPDYRRQGIGKKFVEHSQIYAEKNGIAQLASDCLTDNHLSEIFHKNCGFIEKERVICFVKNVEP
jgi:aminoglycoside 6'-N-acetyltransferase I